MSERVYRALHSAQRRGDHVCLLQYREVYVSLAHMLDDEGMVRDGLGRVYAGKLRSGRLAVDAKLIDKSTVEGMLHARMMLHLKKNRRRGAVVYRMAASQGEVRQAFIARFGYSVEELKAHLESLFSPGMTWELVRKMEVHIDHKYPARMFNLSTVDGIKRAYALDNLQPMWRRDNIVKGRTTDAEVLALFGEGLC